MNQIAMDKLLDLLQKPTVSYLQGGTLHIAVEQCSEADKAFFDAIIQQSQSARSELSEKLRDFQQYFAEIESLPVYKPANPTLAILQVAKKYQLDHGALTKAFKHRGQKAL